MKQKSSRNIFPQSQMNPGMARQKLLSQIGNQPPKNKIEAKAEIKIILAYSPRKNIENGIELYSTL